MPNKPNVNNRQVGLRVSVELCRKVEVGFGRDGDTYKSEAFIRALEEATRDVALTVADYEAIAAEVRANRQKAKEDYNV